MARTLRRLLVTLAMLGGLVAVPTASGAGILTPGVNGYSANLLANGDAETGDFTGWTTSALMAIDGATPLTGSYSFLATASATPQWMSQTVDVSQYSDAIDAGGIFVYVEYSADTGIAPNANCFTYVDLYSFSPETALVTKGGPGVYPISPGMTEVEVRLVGLNNDAGCSPRFDNIVLSLAGLPTCDGYTATHVGTPGPDVITGTADDDVIVSLAGDDEVDGLAGDDIICLGSGADLASGGPGEDTIFGGPGRDEIHGNGHADWIFGGGAKDRIYGDGNLDRLYGDAGHDRIRGGVGNDLIRGGDGNDRLIGNGGNDIILGGDGDDVARGKAGFDGCEAEAEYSCEGDPV